MEEVEEWEIDDLIVEACKEEEYEPPRWKSNYGVLSRLTGNELRKLARKCNIRIPRGMRVDDVRERLAYILSASGYDLDEIVKQ